MIDQPFTESERRRLLMMAIQAVPHAEPPDTELLQIIGKLSGVDTVLVARRAYSVRASPPRIGECHKEGDSLVCRRFYDGDSACTQYGGKMRCLRVPPDV
jgi:hypothetical protein